MGSHLDSWMTDMTTPIGMATPIAPDLVWPGHPDIQGQAYFLGTMIQQLYLLEDWILMKGGRYTILMIYQEFADLPWIPQTIYDN